MIRYSIFVVLLLCINISGRYAQQCQVLSKGYTDYYQCVLSCYKDSYKMQFIFGDLCTAKVQFGGNAPNGFTVAQVEESINCITARCRSAVPPSVCDITGSSGGTTPASGTTNVGSSTGSTGAPSSSSTTAAPSSTTAASSSTTGSSSSTTGGGSSTTGGGSSTSNGGSRYVTDANGNVFEEYLDCDDDTQANSGANTGAEAYADADSYPYPDDYPDDDYPDNDAPIAAPTADKNSKAPSTSTASSVPNNVPNRGPPVPPIPPIQPGPEPNDGRVFYPENNNRGSLGNTQFQNTGGQAAPLDLSWLKYYNNNQGGNRNQGVPNAGYPAIRSNQQETYLAPGVVRNYGNRENFGGERNIAPVPVLPAQPQMRFVQGERNTGEVQGNRQFFINNARPAPPVVENGGNFRSINFQSGAPGNTFGGNNFHNSMGTLGQSGSIQKTALLNHFGINEQTGPVKMNFGRDTLTVDGNQAHWHRDGNLMQSFPLH